MAEAIPLEGVTAKVRRILVVDDDQDFADTIVELLEARDYSVKVANDDRRAQAAAADFAPEIALIDIRLGRASGVDLVSALKGRWPELICIMVTAYAGVDEAVKALCAGADDLLTKPLEPAMLFAALERGFAKHTLIREKLAAEVALRDSELRFRSVAQSATDAMISVDGAGNIIFWNTAAEKIFGYQEDEILGKSLTFLMPARYREAHESGIARLNASGESRITGTTVELHGLKRDGTEFPIELSLVAWASGEQKYFTGILRDITVRKRAEESLREAHETLEIKVVERTRALSKSEQRFRDFSEASSDWFWEMDENLRFSYFSDRFTEVTGVPPEMLLGKTREETGVPDVDPDEWEVHLANLAAHRPFRDFRHPRTRLDGRVVHLSINGKPVSDEAGNFRGYRGTGSDITAQIQMEQSLRLTQFVIDHANDAVFWLDRDGLMTFVNDTTCRMLGYTRKELLALNISDIDPDAHPGDFARVWKRIKTTGPTTFEARHRTKGGTVIPVEVSLSYMKRGDEELACSFTRDITARKRDEEALTRAHDELEQRVEERTKELRESEERYRELFDESPTAIWVEDWSAIKQMLDDLTRGGVKDWPGYFNSHRDQLMTAYNLAEVIDISSATVELYGQDSKEHLLQMTVAEAVIDEELDAFRDMVLSFLMGQMTVDIEAKDTAGDGSEIIVRRRVVVPPDHRDDWSRVIYAIEDITERKRAEEALHESEALFRDYAEASADWFWEMDTDLRFTYMSENVERILGVAPEWHYGKTRIDLLGGVYDRNLWQDHLKTLREHKPFQNFEYPGAVDGVEPVWTRISGVPVFAEDGAFLGYRGTGSNITEVKRTEEAIRTRDAWLEGIMENTPTQIVLKDIEGRIMAISQNAAEALGLSREDFIGHTTADFLPAEIADIYMNADREVIETDRLVQQEVAEENEDGSIRHMLSAKFPLKDGGGQILGVCSLTTDITEMKEVQSRLNQAQKMEAIGQLTGGIAHDFNNLLAIMLGNTELLWEFVGEHEQAKEFFETVIEMIDRGSSLTQRLLAFSRQSTLSPAALDVTDLIGGLGVMLRRTLGETVDLRIEAPPDLWPATIDPHQFENALINLAVNARDAMPQGGTLTFETANVTLDETYATQHEEVTPGDYVVFAVSDSGSGMPPEVLEKVFEPFFTTKDVGKGSGLGLSMVYGFAKQSKGHITISSEVGHGTTVKLYMPRSEEDFVQEGAKDETREFAGGSERILVVEDDERVRAVPVNILRKRGYEIVEAVDGKAAIKHLKDGQPFDLLLTDVVLPGGMNGVEIAEQAKRIQPNIKVIFATGYTKNAVVHSGQLDSDVTLLNKPYRRAELLGKVRALLDSGDD